MASRLVVESRDCDFGDRDERVYLILGSQAWLLRVTGGISS
jgi:hypothetical protein